MVGRIGIRRDSKKTNEEEVLDRRDHQYSKEIRHIEEEYVISS